MVEVGAGGGTVAAEAAQQLGEPACLCQHVGDIEFPPGQARVAGGLPAHLDPLTVPLGAFPAGPGSFGAELLLQGVGLAGQPLGPQLRGGLREYLVRVGRAGRRMDA